MSMMTQWLGSFCGGLYLLPAFSGAAQRLGPVFWGKNRAAVRPGLPKFTLSDAKATG